jgi:hypothetical protein
MLDEELDAISALASSNLAVDKLSTGWQPVFYDVLGPMITLFKTIVPEDLITILFKVPNRLLIT